MHRIDSATAQQDKFGAGKDGFTAGTPPTVPPTDMTAEWHDEVQEEPSTVIEGAGMPLIKGRVTQLDGAIRSLIGRAALGWWRKQTNPKNSNIRSVAANDLSLSSGTWVAVGSSDGVDAYIATAQYPQEESESWVERANPKAVDLLSVCHAPDINVFVAVGLADGVDAYIVTSTALGSVWTERANPKNLYLAAVVRAQFASKFFAVGQADTDAYIISSSDGAAWVEIANPHAGALTAIAVSESQGILVAAISSGASAMLRSVDGGLTWAYASTPPLTNAASVVWAEYLGLFVAVGAGYVYTSPDGDVWSTVSTTPFVDVRGLAVSEDACLLVFVGASSGQAPQACCAHHPSAWHEFPTRNVNVAANAVAYSSLRGHWVIVGNLGSGVGGLILQSQASFLR